jgi:hypothetical protein
MKIYWMRAGLSGFSVGLFCSYSNFSPIMAAPIGFIGIDNYGERLATTRAGSI